MHHVDPKIAAKEMRKSHYDRIVKKLEDISRRYGLNADDMRLAVGMCDAIHKLCMGMVSMTGVKNDRASGILIAALTQEIGTIESVANDVHAYGAEAVQASCEAEAPQ